MNAMGSACCFKRGLALLVTFAVLLPISGSVQASAGSPTVRVGICLPEAGTGAKEALLYAEGGFSVYPTDRLTLHPRSDGSLELREGTTGRLLETRSHGTPITLKGNAGIVTLTANGKTYPYPASLLCSVKDGRLKIIAMTDLETYAKCVMANEIGTNASREVRLAFSLLVRTVALHGRKHREAGADVCASTCCQLYLGNHRRSEENDAIVDATRGQYLTYEGKPITCPYHHSNGGATCSAAAAWGGSGTPYLVSVFLEETEAFPGKTWEKAFTQDELSAPGAFSALGKVVSLEIGALDPHGSAYVTKVTAEDEKGNRVTLETCERIRNVLGIPTGNFTLCYLMKTAAVTESGETVTLDARGYVDAEGSYVLLDSFTPLPVTGASHAGADTLLLTGKGQGHGVGFSSQGAEQLAAKGWKYPAILQFYFPGTEIGNLMDSF